MQNTQILEWLRKALLFFAAVFLLLSVVAIAASWTPFKASLINGVWVKQTYLLLTLFLISLTFAVACLKMSHLQFQYMQDIVSVIVLLVVLAFLSFVFAQQQIADQGLMTFLFLLFLLSVLHIVLRNVVASQAWALVLVLVFPLFAIICMVKLYLYVFADAQTWDESRDVRYWAVTGYLILIALQAVFLWSYRNRFKPQQTSPL